MSTCPSGGAPVTVALMQGLTTLASASTTASTKGKWAVTMSIPTNLTPGTYAVTANCGGAVPLSYKAQSFRVTPPPTIVGLWP